MVTSWRTASVAVLRMAGFPFEWLGRLAAEDVTAMAYELLDRQRVVTDGKSSAPVPPANRADRAVLRAVRRGVPYQPRDEEPSPAFAALLAEHATALAARDKAARAFRAAYDDAWQRSAVETVALFRRHDDLRDVILVSNEDAYARLVAWIDTVDADVRGWRKKDRNNLTTVVRYLQRVCAKNDTTSHFGPLAPGRLDPARRGVHWTPSGLTRRTSLSRWAARVVADHIARPELLRPRKAPGSTLDGHAVQVVTIDQAALSTDVRTVIRVVDPVALDPCDLVLFGLCDGVTTLPDIARAAGLPLADAHARLRRLEEHGAVRMGVEIPYGVDDGLAWLTARAGADDRVCAALTARVNALQDAAPANRPAALGELKELFTTATGCEPYRPGGGFYSDRSVFHEHCVGATGDLVIGQPLVDRMRGDLGLLYDMFLLRPRWRIRLERQVIGDWFVSRFGRGVDVTVPRYLAAFLADLDTLEARYARVDERVARIGDALERALLPDTDEHVHVVERAVVENLVREYGVDEPAICNPDLMVAAADPDSIAAGRFRLVVGDLHAIDEHLSHGSIAPFVHAAFPHYRSEIATLYGPLLRPDEVLGDVTQYHLNKTFPRIDPECLDIEVFDRSPRPPAGRLRLGELVLRHAGELRLRTPAGQALRLMIPPHAWPMLRRNPFAVFGFPVGTDEVAVHGTGRAHLPRVQVGDIVLQRELWRVRAPDAVDDADAFLSWQEIRRDREFPRHVFVSCPNEPKPVYCDLDSPLLVRQLTRLVRAGDPVTVSEMLPGPDELWLSDPRGHCTSELRYAVFAASPRDALRNRSRPDVTTTPADEQEAP